MFNAFRMAFNPPSRSQPLQPPQSLTNWTVDSPSSQPTPFGSQISTISAVDSSRDLSTDKDVTNPDLNASMEAVLAAAVAVRNSAKKARTQSEERERSASQSRFKTSTPIRGRSTEKEETKKEGKKGRKLFSNPATTTTTGDEEAPEKQKGKRGRKKKDEVKNRVFDDDMEKSRPAESEVDAASCTANSATETPDAGNTTRESLNMSRMSAGLNDSRMSWGQVSGITVASLRSTRTTRGGGGTRAAGTRVRAYWTELLKIQREWYIKVTSSTFSSSSASKHVLDSYEELRKELCSFSAKPPEAISAIELFAVHATRFYEFLTERAIPESSTALAELTHAVLTKYMANPSHTNENDRAWLLAKHILEMIIVIPSSTDILLCVKSTILQIQTEFVRVWASSHADRDLRFIAYVLKVLDALLSSLSSRISTVVNAITFGYSED